MSPNHQTIRLIAGRHTHPDGGVCVMELASMLAGDRFTDRPESVSRTLAALLRGYNDGLDDTRRQSLKYYASASIGTACGRAAERRRRRVIRAWLAGQRGTHGPLAALGRRLATADVLAVGLKMAHRVCTDGDEALHARMLCLFDSLIAAGRTAPLAMTIPSWEAIDDGCRAPAPELGARTGAPADV